MTDLSRDERERRLACYKQRAEARRERLRQAEACCPDCATAVRTDRLDRTRYHTEQAERLAAGAVQAAGGAARAALRARRANIVGTAILVPFSLLLLVLSVIVLANG